MTFQEKSENIFLQRTFLGMLASLSLRPFLFDQIFGEILAYLRDFQEIIMYVVHGA